MAKQKSRGGSVSVRAYTRSYPYRHGRAEKKGNIIAEFHRREHEKKKR